jgi:hypothetical protein
VGLGATEITTVGNRNGLDVPKYGIVLTNDESRRNDVQSLSHPVVITIDIDTDFAH